MNHRTIMSRTLIASAMLAFLPIAADAQVRQYVHFQQGINEGWGILQGQNIQRLNAAPYMGGTPTGQSVALSSVTLLPPANPRTAVVVNVNYPSGGDMRDNPTIITLPPRAFIGSGSPVLRPTDVEELSAEATAAVVIGRTATNVTPQEAPQYILGVAPAIDVTAEDWRSGQWTRAKGTDTFKPVGPVVVSGVNYNNLTIVGRVNGEEVSRVNTSEMYHDFNELVSFISGYMTLNPGDVVMAGTAGEDARALVDSGDLVEVEIQGVGTLSNPVISADPDAPTLPPPFQREQ